MTGGPIVPKGARRPIFYAWLSLVTSLATITLKFADAIGEVLTAGPVKDVPPLPFRYYI